MWYINEENHQYLVVVVAKSSEKITSCTLVSTLTLLAPGSNLPLLAPGGICPPPTIKSQEHVLWGLDMIGYLREVYASH